MKAQAPKTPKLFIGGQFVRSESNRTYKHADTNVPLATRKDVRDAVSAARKAFGGWSNATAYNRGQILYRLAEMMESRTFSGVEEDEHRAAVELAVHFSGWTDKLGSLLSSVNPVAGQIHNFTKPEPVGVVGAIVPAPFPLASLLMSALPPLATGCTVVAVLPQSAPLPGLELAEALATSDLPNGVLNLLTGLEAEMAPHLADHVDVDALDITGSEDPVGLATRAGDTIKRIHNWPQIQLLADIDSVDTLERAEAWLEQKTVWHATAW
jgi:acyl-CoA reductase-like NAD-dependent aldehyde dehydrogenase